MGDGVIMIAGDTVGWKAKLFPTVAMSSPEAADREAVVMGWILLFCRSILWDLGVPQCAAPIGYKDNAACTSITLAKKPTPRTRRTDIKYHVICQWVKQYLIKLDSEAVKEYGFPLGLDVH